MNYYSNYTNVLLYSNAHASSFLEIGADLLLAPARELFKGKKVVLLENDQNSLRFARPCYEYRTTMENVAIKVAAVVGLIFAPFGLLLKQFVCLMSASTKAFYANWEAPVSFADIKRECKARGLAKEFIFEVIKDPIIYLAPQVSSYRLNPLLISENHQLDSFNRKTSKRRAEFETSICDDLERTYGAAKDQPLNLLIGFDNKSGLFQEWVLVGKLIQRGFTKFNFSFVGENIDPAARDGFMSLFDGMPGVEVNLSAYQNVTEFTTKAQPASIHGIFAIEDQCYEEPGHWDALKKARSLLKPEGKLYFSANFLRDAIIEKSGNVRVINALESIRIPIHFNLWELDRKIDAGQRAFLLAGLLNTQDTPSVFGGRRSVRPERIKEPLYAAICHLRAKGAESIELHLLGNTPNQDAIRRDFESFSTDTMTVKVTWVESESDPEYARGRDNADVRCGPVYIQWRN